VLELCDIHKSFRKDSRAVDVLSGLDLRVDAGQFAAVQGPSGCGKSTLLLVAGALLHPDAGTVRIDGQDPYSLSSDERAMFRAAKLGFVFQQFHLVPYLTVLENVLAAGLASGKDGRDRADALLDKLGMTDRMHHLPSELSVGQRQRTALARAMLNRPRVLLADEPTGNLDPDNAHAVLDQLKALACEGAAVLLVSHSAAAVGAAGKVYQLGGGVLEPEATKPEATK
jgi:ABC-type lipoprotein export system ATPase subunit